MAIDLLPGDRVGALLRVDAPLKTIYVAYGVLAKAALPPGKVGDVINLDDGSTIIARDTFYWADETTIRRRVRDWEDDGFSVVQAIDVSLAMPANIPPEHLLT